MLHKKRLLYTMFYAPGVVALIRCLMTIWYFAKNPLGLPLRYIQLVPMIAILVAMFMYFRLYSDGVPVITVIAPTMLHFILVLVFMRRVVIVPFIPLVLTDILLISLKGIKANMFPFDIEGDDDDLDNMDDLFEDA